MRFRACLRLYRRDVAPFSALGTEGPLGARPGVVKGGEAAGREGFHMSFKSLKSSGQFLSAFLQSLK